MILGYERLHHHGGLDYGYWNFNGRYEPSTLALDPGDIASRWDTKTTGVYKMLIDPHNFPLHNSTAHPWSNILFYHAPQNSRIVRMCVDDITTEKYIYPIIVKHAGVYCAYTSHVSISPKVRTHVESGQATIVFVHHLEGTLRKYKNQFDKLVADLCLPAEQVYLLQGDLDAEYYNNSPYTYKAINCFPFWISPFYPSESVDYKPGRLFCSYNRYPREHRLCLLYELIRNNLIDQGIVSCGVLEQGSVADIFYRLYGERPTDHELASLMRLSNHSPDNLYLNPHSLDSKNPAQNVVHEHYCETFVSVVSETLDTGLFYSEKTYKPIALGHPFILNAGPGQLAFLRTMGFQTFDKWWDESYDQEQSLVARVSRIVDVLKQLHGLSTQQLIALRHDMQPVLDHNRDVFRRMTLHCPADQKQNLFNAFLAMMPK
jgi:hypothetical protein